MYLERTKVVKLYTSMCLETSVLVVQKWVEALKDLKTKVKIKKTTRGKTSPEHTPSTVAFHLLPVIYLKPFLVRHGILWKR